MQDTVAQQLLAIRQQLGEIQATVNLMQATTTELGDRVKVIEESASVDRRRATLMEWLGTDTGRKIGAALSLVATAAAGYLAGLLG